VGINPMAITRNRIVSKYSGKINAKAAIITTTKLVIEKK
jgi:hypothetical protein